MWVLATTFAFAKAPAASPAVGESVESSAKLVEFELMSWPEVKQALADGKTTALFYTGGTEQRGPQDANGGHKLVGKAAVKTSAQEMGKAIAMPLLPFTPKKTSAPPPRTTWLGNEIPAPLPERSS